MEEKSSFLEKILNLNIEIKINWFSIRYSNTNVEENYTEYIFDKKFKKYFTVLIIKILVYFYFIILEINEPHFKSFILPNIILFFDILVFLILFCSKKNKNKNIIVTIKFLLSLTTIIGYLIIR